MTVTTDEMRNAIAAFGTDLYPSLLGEVTALFDEGQKALGLKHPPSIRDVAYGDHERQTLDVYRPIGGGGKSPVLIFVHGGGFVRGDKAAGWMNANVGSFAAASGIVGVVMNYRLAPASTWPAGAEDVASAIGWAKDNIALYGGDPDRIVVMGTSAGAVHVAGHFRVMEESARKPLVAGAVLMSGLYGYTPLSAKDLPYYGEPNDYVIKAPQQAAINIDVPLMVACAEFDPPRFQQEFLGLVGDRLKMRNAMARSLIVQGHNHYSLPMHIGTGDRRFSDELLSFVRTI